MKQNHKNDISMEKNTTLNYLFLVSHNLLIFTIWIAQSHNTKLPELKRSSVNFKILCCFNNTKMQECTGCRCQGFGSGGTAGMASVKKRSGAAFCLTQPVPSPSKIDPSQGTVEPISQAGGYSGRMYIRKGKKWQRGRGGGSKKSEKQQRECQGQRSRWRCPMAPQQVFTVSHGQPTLGRRKEGRAEHSWLGGSMTVGTARANPTQEERDNSLFFF